MNHWLCGPLRWQASSHKDGDDPCGGRLASEGITADFRGNAPRASPENSTPPPAHTRDVLSSACPGYCTSILRGQLQAVLDRARQRGEQGPNVERLLDLLVAPTVFRILFAEAPPSLQQLHELVELALHG